MKKGSLLVQRSKEMEYDKLNQQDSCVPSFYLLGLPSSFMHSFPSFESFSSQRREGKRKREELMRLKLMRHEIKVWKFA